MRPRRSDIAIALLAAASLLATPASAQQDQVRVEGVVLSPQGLPLAGASLRIAEAEPVFTDAQGRFVLQLPPGEHECLVVHPDYPALSLRLVAVDDGSDLLLRMQSLLTVSETISVSAIRAEADAPVTKTELDRRQLDAMSYGQDVPALLQHTPSMTWYSDSGVGSNYSYFSLRGIQQTRINMTFDGVPLNDPAENAVYFNNLHDIIGEVDSVQIQRGVGTSSVGSPSYGGSVNFASRPPGSDMGAEVRLGAGAFDTRRASAALHSGRFGDGFSATARMALSSTEGYRERSGSDHRTLFARAAWEGQRSTARLTAVSGRERTQLAFLAVEPDILESNRRFNPMDERETDEFTQTIAQLQYAHAIDEDTLLSASAYYNGARGWFRLWDDPLARTQLQQYGIDQGFWGAMLSASRDTGRLGLNAGLHFNDYAGDHTLDAGGTRQYENTGYKQTLNAFAKGEVRFDRWLLFGDLQLRWAEFRYRGAIDLGSVHWTFLDPRVGARWFASPELSFYVAAGRAQREPTRLDLLAGEDDATVAHDLGAVRPESVFDVEVGVGYATDGLSLQANLYAMEFRDEIALTGELSDIGLPLRRNVDASFRRGLELDLRWRASSQWTLLHSLNLSRNRIGEWTQYYDVYSSDGSWVDSRPLTFTDVPPLLTPQVIANLGVEWSRESTAVALTARYVGTSQLDNTGLPDFRLPDWATLDLSASLGLGKLWPGGDPRLELFVNNLLDSTSPYPSGYSYQYLQNEPGGAVSATGISYFYPLATRNAVVQLSFGF